MTKLNQTFHNSKCGYCCEAVNPNSSYRIGLTLFCDEECKDAFDFNQMFEDDMRAEADYELQYRDHE